MGEMCERRGGLIGSRFSTGAIRMLSRGLGKPFAPLPGLLPSGRIVGPEIYVERDLPYHPDGKAAHLLDVYRPADRSVPHPVVFYIHGGGFQTLSKDSHWVMAVPFAKREYVVVTINYRLAPEYPFPAALVDCARALCWFAQRAGAFGADLNRVVFAGESAGANLSLALAMLGCHRRKEPWALRVHELGFVPRAYVSYYGLLQVTDAGRFRRINQHIPDWIQRQIVNVCDAYLDVDPRVPLEALELADPLILLERSQDPVRPLPACFGAVGAWDPLKRDTDRLVRAARAHGAAAQGRCYDGQTHGFHALGWTRAVRQCWSDTFDFLDEHL